MLNQDQVKELLKKAAHQLTSHELEQLVSTLSRMPNFPSKDLLTHFSHFFSKEELAALNPPLEPVEPDAPVNPSGEPEPNPADPHKKADGKKSEDKEKDKDKK
jgi:hypothetical protein